MNGTKFTAVIRQEGPWWIGWIEEISGVNSQGETREELLENLADALSEMIAMNRESAKTAAGDVYEEVAITLRNVATLSAISWPTAASYFSKAQNILGG